MKKIVVSVAGALAVALGGVAHASTPVTLHSHSGSLGTSTSTKTNDANAFASTWTGAQRLSEGQFGAQFMAYCIDPRTGTGFPTQYSTTTLDAFFGVGSANYSASGYSQQLQRSVYSDIASRNTQSNALTVRNNLNELFSYAYADSLLSSTNAAAFGLAIWEVMMQDGGTFSRSSGEIRSNSTGTSTSNAVISKLNSYLSALSAASGSLEQAAWSTAVGGAVRKNYTYTVYFDTTSPFSQSFIRAKEITNQVPLPGSLALAGLALGALLWQRKRKA